MTIYIVEVHVPLPRVEEWYDYMTNGHIADVVATGYFVSGTLSRVIDPVDDNVAIFRVQYVCHSVDDIAAYRATAAATLQAHHTERFGTDVIAVRSVTEEIWKTR